MEIKENVTEEKVGDVLVVKSKFLSATVHIAAQFKEYILRKIEAGEDKIVIDLSEIGYMDSSFLGSLVISLKKANAGGGSLKLIMKETGNPVWAMFENTRMLKVFETYEDLDSALNSF